MARLNSPDGFVSSVDIQTQRGKTRLRADKDGKYSNLSPAQEKALRSQGFTEEALTKYSAGDSARGYTCTQCGFGSWFRKCSRCGHETLDTPRDGEVEYGSSNSD